MVDHQFRLRLLLCSSLVLCGAPVVVLGGFDIFVTGCGAPGRAIENSLALVLWKSLLLEVGSRPGLGFGLVGGCLGLSQGD